MNISQVKINELKNICKALHHLKDNGIDIDVIIRYVSHKTKIPMHKVRKVLKTSKKYLGDIVAEEL